MTFVFPDGHGIDGYSGEAECRALYDLACQVPDRGVIVELGAYKGRTAISMAQSGRSVYTVDRFEAEEEDFIPLPDHRTGNFSAEDIHVRAQFYGVPVYVIQADTDKAWRYWVTTMKPAISLLFIDADHHYEAVKRDFEQWSQLVTEDGVIVFDDSTFDGVQRCLLEIDEWAPIPGPQVGGLTALRRITEVIRA